MLRIVDFPKQETITTTLAVLRKQTRTTHSGNPYLHLDLIDRTGKISAKVWDESKSSIYWDDIQVNEVFLFTAKVEEYQSQPQLIIQDIQFVDSYQKEDFIAVIKEDRDELMKELRSYIGIIENSYLQKLITLFMDDKDFVAQLYEAPAAQFVHDSKLGGLLRHTTRLIRLGLTICDMYSEMSINRDLVVAGLFFHDIAKIEELSWEGATITYTDRGRFIGHDALGMMYIYEKIHHIEGFPDDLADQLIHLVASHAGEFGIKMPATIEAMVVRYCDMMDSQLVHFQQEWVREAGIGWKRDKLLDHWCYYPEI